MMPVMGIEKLIDVLLQFIDLFRFWTVVQDGNVTVIFTLGRFQRVLNPGIYFKAPFDIQTDVEVSVKEELTTLFNQDLMTKDGKTVRVSGVFRFQILPEKAEIWVNELGDETTALPAMLRAAIGETIIRRDYEELMADGELKGLKQEILDRARNQLNRYGYKIYDFWWAERTAGKTYRFITGE